MSKVSSNPICMLCSEGSRQYLMPMIKRCVPLPAKYETLMSPSFRFSPTEKFDIYSGGDLSYATKVGTYTVSGLPTDVNPDQVVFKFIVELSEDEQLTVKAELQQPTSSPLDVIKS